MYKPLPKIDKTWTLFLDRDGIINKRYFDRYVRTWEDFIFLPEVLPTLKRLTNEFARVFIVTNQQGIGKKLMTEEEYAAVTDKMLTEIRKAGGKVDKVYHCPHLKTEDCACSKPKPGMALQAKKDFPDIDLKRSIMVGDCDRDMEFGQGVGMLNIFIKSAESREETDKTAHTFKSLKEFCDTLLAPKKVA